MRDRVTVSGGRAFNSPVLSWAASKKNCQLVKYQNGESTITPFCKCKQGLQDYLRQTDTGFSTTLSPYTMYCDMWFGDKSKFARFPSHVPLWQQYRPSKFRIYHFCVADSFCATIGLTTCDYLDFQIVLMARLYHPVEADMPLAMQKVSQCGPLAPKYMKSTIITPFSSQNRYVSRFKPYKIRVYYNRNAPFENTGKTVGVRKHRLRAASNSPPKDLVKIVAWLNKQIPYHSYWWTSWKLEVWKKRRIPLDVPLKDIGGILWTDCIVKKFGKGLGGENKTIPLQGAGVDD